jgi:hypothetical protein
MNLNIIWKMHQPNCWHPRQNRMVLPWTRLHALRSWMPLLRLALEPGALPFTIAISPDALQYLERCTTEGQRDYLLELQSKPAEALRDPEIAELLGFAFEASSAKLAAPYPRYAALFARWQAMRGNLPRLKATLCVEDLQDLQTLAPLAWLHPELKAQAGDRIEERACAGDSMRHEDAVALADFQVTVLRDFLSVLQEACRARRVEYLGGALHQAILPLLADAAPGFVYAEDARAHIVRGPRVHYQHFALWPPILHLAEGGFSPDTASLMAQSCLEWAVASSRVLEKSLGRPATAPELAACWHYRKRGLRFVHTSLSDRFRLVYPRLSANAAFQDFAHQVEDFRAAIHAANREDTPEPEESLSSLLVEVDASLDETADLDDTLRLWRMLLHQFPQQHKFGCTRLDTQFTSAGKWNLSSVAPYTGRAAGFRRWLEDAHPLYWRLLRHARRQFQNVRAWKTLSAETLNSARESLLILESKDWADCMETGLDSWTRRRMEELLRAHFEAVWRLLEVERPSDFSESFLPCETRVTSIGPSGHISPGLDGKRSSYTSWSGSGYFRAREEGTCGGDPWRQISELHYGADETYVYLRVALPLSAQEMLSQFDLQGVFHAVEGEHTVSWFQVRCVDGRTDLSTRLAVPPAPRAEEQPESVVDELVDLRIPLSALGVRMGEVLRLQVSLWERGNAVAAAPPLGWEEFVLEDPLEQRGFLAGAEQQPDYWDPAVIR